MSLATQISNLTTRIATEFKSLRNLVNGGATDLTALSTSNKTNLVAAINEVASSVGEAGASINDTTTSTLSVWSSSKTNSEISGAVASVVGSSPATLDTLAELGDALGDDPNFATTMTTALGNRVRYDAAQTLTGPQQAQARANIAAGTSNVVVGTSAGQAADAVATTNALALKAPIANPTFTGTVSGISKVMVGLGNVDNTSDVNKPISTATQTALNAKEDKVNIGDPETNYVTIFEAGLL